MKLLIIECITTYEIIIGERVNSIAIKKVIGYFRLNNSMAIKDLLPLTGKV